MKPTLIAPHRATARRALASAPDQGRLLRRIDELGAQVTALEGRIEALHGSTSWRVSAPVRWLSRQLQRLRGVSPASTGPRDATYAEWVRCYDQHGMAPAPASGLVEEGGPDQPRFAILLTIEEQDAALLASTVDALLAQRHGAWELCMRTGAAATEGARAALALYAARDARIRLDAEASGDWVLPIEPGDILPAHALLCMARAIAETPGVRLVYADEDVLDAEGTRSDPCFKPDWNIDLLRSGNLSLRPCAFARTLFAAADGWRGVFDAAAEYDIALLCSEHLVSSQVRHLPQVLCHRRADAGESAERRGARLAALRRHLLRIDANADAEDTGNELRVRYRLPAPPPAVTLIVPTRNAVALLRQCIESIVGGTAYPDFDILVIDNGSDDPDALAYLRELGASPGIEVVRDDGPFNYAGLNNRAVARARGEVVALVNNDVEVGSSGWLQEMVSIAVQPGVGAVGAKLLFADETVQHGGVLLGVGGIAAHAHKHVPAWHPGYFQRAQSLQSMSAVTAACLVVQKRLYEEVGGLDERHLKVAYNDIDFCLKLQAAGYRNVWTPHAVLFHHESATRGQEVSDAQRARLAEEELCMRQRWSNLIANDPAYNPNLTIHAENFGLAWPPRVLWIRGAAQP